MSYTVSDPTLLPPATAPPPLLAWAQENSLLVIGVIAFIFLELNNKPYRRKRRRKR